MQTQTLVAGILSKSSSRFTTEVISFVVGLGLLCALAQVSIALPWTPVPITGQTFGVALVALAWGRIRGLGIVISYLFIGAIGFPVFSAGRSALTWGPTFGYLIGMVLAALLVGFLSDRGWSKSFFRAWMAASLGSLVIFSCGLWVLSYFIPTNGLLAAGLLPFIPGDLIKNSLAALIISRANKKLS